MPVDAHAHRLNAGLMGKAAESQGRASHFWECVEANQLRVIVLFQRRDAAGKHGTIEPITEKGSPRVFARLPCLGVGSREVFLSVR
jgi:polyphosphate kinase 2 (PPK2 family)